VERGGRLAWAGCTYVSGEGREAKGGIRGDEEGLEKKEKMLVGGRTGKKIRTAKKPYPVEKACFGNGSRKREPL